MTYMEERTNVGHFPVVNMKVEHQDNSLITHTCYFPTQEHPSKIDLQRCSIDVPFGERSKQNSRLDNNTILQPEVFATAWALLLGCYTGGESISFGFRRAFRGLDAVGERAMLLYEKEIACQVELDRIQPVSMAMQNIRHQLDTLEAFAGFALRPYNTIVRYRECSIPNSSTLNCGEQTDDFEISEVSATCPMIAFR